MRRRLMILILALLLLAPAVPLLLATQPDQTASAQTNVGDHSHLYYAWCYVPNPIYAGYIVYRVVWHNWFHWKIDEYYWQSATRCSMV